MSLQNLWFTLIAVLWCGYFVLEGFDFGVGVLLHAIGRDERERGLLLRTIGPVWDGNEVWLLVAGGATFAAFPQWYATLFSGFYLALLLILVALIVRVLAIEYRNKESDPVWRKRWDLVHSVSAAVPALLWGVAFGNIVRGVPIDAAHNYTGSFFTLLNPYALLGGLTTLTVFTLHGAVFLALKTTGELRDRARKTVLLVGPGAAIFAVGFLTWTLVDLDGASHGHIAASAVAAVLAALTLVGGLLATWKDRDGWAFAGTAAAIVATTAALFLALHPAVMPSTTSAAYSLTVTNASSSHYTLTVMSWVALAFTPLVLLYQAWTYWVFRARVTGDGSVSVLARRSGPEGELPGHTHEGSAA
ncbi:cytochrome d ubiquinol oxidase subunit II [Actinocrinis puniceicyclus]|uniref:Cytochrome d ubiquinol oxidase subunit II n=1 Tax=Actinocrinis puniceicyclus TaxID=977794 RepID=A0A8J7WKJ8_9ACTN|nr:cytochrome d ubiquinol oxidase subunit II [Actinocrinis puniceicyclus]MBS2961514.1 cytochrome d ubiquinol oxidase subunit II [Actinocrinis puniceicyclus]